jgi:hypothetical protein
MNAPLPAPRAIPEWERVDRRRFLEEVRPAGEPAILRGVARDWPAVTAAGRSDEAVLGYIERFATAEPVEMVVAPPEVEGRLSYNGDMSGLNFVRGLSPVASFFARLLRDRGERRPYAMAMQSAAIAKLLPGFERENVLDLPLAPVPPRLWIGNALKVAIHADMSENIAVNVAGRRRFTLFPPEAMPYLYIGPIEFTPAGPLTSLVHLTDPDLQAFPGFRTAMDMAMEAELGPGDAIYIPFHWWHHVESLDGVNILVNYWWNVESRLPVASPMDATMLAMLVMRDLPPDQRRAFAAMIRHYVLAEEGDPAGHIPTEVRGILGPVSPETLRSFRDNMREKLK